MKRLAFLFPLALVACESQKPPAACGPIPQVTVNAGETASVTACFNDPNGDALAYSATSSNPGVATASVSGADITVAAVAPGIATVTVTASDPGGLNAEQSFQVMVPNRAPQPRGTMPSIAVPVDQAETVDAAAYFTEPDGETLTYSATSSNAAAATVAVTGSTVTVTALAKGTTNVVVTARDPGGLTATQTFEVTVPNRAPVAGDPIPDAEVFVGNATEVDASEHFSDPDGDALSYTASTSDARTARVSVSGSTVRVEAVGQGSATVTVTATDPEGLSAESSFEVTVPNRAPVAGGPIPDAEVFVGDATEVDASEHFSDPDGDALAYTASTSDARAARVSVSGSTVRVEAVRLGSATVTVTATDPEGLSAESSFEVTVPNRAPVAGGPIPDAEVFVGNATEVDASEHFSDPDGDALAYAASTSDARAARVSVSGTTVRVEAVRQGSATVTVTATDPGGLTARQSFAVKILNPDRRVLETLYNALGGSGWTTDTNWLTDAPLDEWYGVTTNGTGRVVRLDLRENGVAGEIPAEVGRLRFLERLDLAVNRVDESPPPSATSRGARMPASCVTRPRHCAAGDAWLRGDPDRLSADGSLPPAVGGVGTKPHEPAGRPMPLRSDGITGPIPRELGDLSNLEVLRLGGNSLTGPIPRELGDLSNLVGLSLYSNSLTGTIPRELGNLSSLESLWISENRLTGEIPGSYLELDLSRFWFGYNNGLCAPNTDAFTSWLDGIDEWDGPRCEQNRPPRPVGTIPDQDMFEDDTLSLDVEDYFSDPDGDELTYSVESSRPSVATASMSGSTVTVVAVAPGTATMTVTATDPGDLSATQTFRVTVSARESFDFDCASRAQSRAPFARTWEMRGTNGRRSWKTRNWTMPRSIGQ